MTDAVSLRERFPEIQWDEPIALTTMGHELFWACRICVCLVGVKGADLIDGRLSPGVYRERDDCVEHITTHPRRRG